MSSFLYDLRYLQAGVEVLKELLFSQEVYFPIGAQPPAGEPPYPVFTLGGMMLALLRAEGRANSAEEKAQINDVASQIKPIYSEWRAAWGNKAAQEIRSRITQWGNFLIDYWENADTNYDRYHYEVFRRVIITLLSPDASGLLIKDENEIDGLDTLLKKNFIAGPFIWENDLEKVFPPAQFWFLYGRLAEKIK